MAETKAVFSPSIVGNKEFNCLIGWDSVSQQQISYTAGTNIVLDPSTGEISASGGGGTPAGSDTYVQFNDGGSFGGDAGFTYNKTTDVATIGGLNLSGQTASRIATFDGSKNLIAADTATYPTLTELSYVKGVTSAIQTQLGSKADFSFKTISVSGQSDVVADSATDTLTLAAGTGISITTNAGTDTITITNTASAGSGLTSGQVFARIMNVGVI